MAKYWRGARAPRGAHRRTKVVPAASDSLGGFLATMHMVGCPRILVKLVYYLLLAYPVTSDDLVDSLEVFAGKKRYSQACSNGL